MEDNQKIKDKFQFRIAISKIREENDIAMHKKLNNNIKKCGIAACLIFALSGVVFAKDIENYFKNLFTYSTPAIESAIENGYVQSTEMNFTYDQGIGIKVDNLILDDLNLAISLAYETPKENLNFIWLDRFTILDDNGDLIYEYENPEKASVGLASSMERSEHPTKVTETTFADSILFGLREKQKEFDSLHFAIRSVRFEYEDHTVETIDGNWNFDIVIDESMKKSETYHYSMVGNNDFVKSCTGTLSATGMSIEIVPNTPITSAEEIDKIFAEMNNSSTYFSLKTDKQLFNLSKCDFDVQTITLKYNTVGNFFEDIDKFELYLPSYDSRIILKKD